MGETTIAWAPLVTASWISAIWQGVSSLVLHAFVVSTMSFGWSVSYFLAPPIIASQKPPVAFVRRVTLIFSFAVPLPLADGAAAALPLADGAADAAEDGAVDAAADGAAPAP